MSEWTLDADRVLHPRQKDRRAAAALAVHGCYCTGGLSLPLGPPAVPALGCPAEHHTVQSFSASANVRQAPVSDFHSCRYMVMGQTELHCGGVCVFMNA